MKQEARLILDDGTEFCGWSFGYEANAVGEVVFNTAMTGYPESLTDPSYAGQILVTTYPLIGNYGVPETGGEPLPKFMENERIHVKGLVVADYSEKYSHWNAKESLAEWLKREKIPAITGIDTRRLTQRLRESGVMRGRIIISENSDYSEHSDYGSINWVEQVSCKEVITYKPDPTAAANSSLFTLHSSFPQGFLFTYKLHGQTRRFDVDITEKDDSLILKYGIQRNLKYWQGSYTMTPEARHHARNISYQQPIDNQHITLPDDELFAILSSDVYSEIKEKGACTWCNTPFKLMDISDGQLHLKDSVEGAEIWVLDNPKLSLIMKMINNPVEIDWEVSRK